MIHRTARATTADEYDEDTWAAY